jgi:hypothetical protein
MTMRALTLALCLVAGTATAEEFQIVKPNNISTMTMPCWPEQQLAHAMTRAKFEPVVRGLLVAKTTVAQPLVVVWLHTMTGRGAVTISHPEGEECLAAVLIDAE